MTSLERSRESLTNDLASTSAQVQSLQEELQTLPVVQNNLQVSSIKCSNTLTSQLVMDGIENFKISRYRSIMP